MASSSTWIVSIKALFISTGVLAVALFLKVSVPLALDFSVSKAPLVWSSFMSWLKPPYLYLVINGIIITIAASSMFHRGSHDAEGDNQKDQIHGVTPSMTISTDPHPAFDYEIKDRTGFGVMESSTVGFEEKRVEAKVLEVVEENRSGYGVMESVAVVYEATRGETKVFELMEEKEMEKRVLTVADGSVVDNEDEFVISRSAWNPPKRMDLSEITSEYLSPAKPLVSSRFGHRKPVKSSPEGGRALRVAKPKRHETLENTWKAITEGRPMPLTRHLKKSDTWENHGRDVNVSLPDPSAVKKSETFKDSTNCQAPPLAPSPMKLRKEPSLSQDELNRRVEAFIKKFNEEMRLQRQESLNQYKEMISRRQ